ncbi:hypothetical protein LCGC14_3103730 [marine sediment metagenome]|uniref:Uncharacterized protein n=1 Tax=marine sediment metagenome TaxID=412755 RepID=A0A0F8YEI9_9ZZZZ
MTISVAQMSDIVDAVEAFNDIDPGEVDDLNCRIATFIQEHGTEAQLIEYCAIEEVAASNCTACQSTGGP